MDQNDISQEEFERIEAYISGHLSKDDVIVFENRLNDDPDFKDKVNDIQSVLIGLETQILKDQLDDFHEEVSNTSRGSESTEVKVRSINWKQILVAAVLVIAAGSFWFLDGSSNERLYAKYFTPDPGLPTTMGSTDNYKFYEAMVNYKRGDYKTAITKWEILQDAKPNNDTLNYFLGVAHLANKNENTAIAFLENTIKNPEFALSDDAYYYLGLAYLKEGNIENAKANFERSNIKNSKVLLSKLND